MKKHIKKLLAICIIACLTLTAVSCTKKKKSENSEQDTLVTPTYLAEPTDSEQNIPSENPTQSTPTEEPTEKPTEAQTPTEPTEEPTEAPTEPSLEYRSYGNGTCSVVGIGDVTDLYVVIPEKNPEGDIVTTIDEKAFYGNNSITVVQIPSTVYSVGNLAFADCKSLVHISVDVRNAHYKDIDGVLFDISMTTLVAYPGAKASSSLMLPETITKICDMALYGCDSLKLIKFEGTVEDWSKVTVGEKNFGLYTANMSFAEST